eukprot:TRINITY_DN4_c23_g1_i1.p1 TRINITY_DN4_c23_g1~~TRINITY_DN4_c23_g1_i1.p1  ORF type:complete len:192 (-),score=3.35 TRINITY_DN4_c23_g1_i1:31-606(-)
MKKKQGPYKQYRLNKEESSEQEQKEKKNKMYTLIEQKNDNWDCGNLGFCNNSKQMSRIENEIAGSRKIRRRRRLNEDYGCKSTRASFVRFLMVLSEKMMTNPSDCSGVSRCSNSQIRFFQSKLKLDAFQIFSIKSNIVTNITFQISAQSRKCFTHAALSIDQLIIDFLNIREAGEQTEGLPPFNFFKKIGF